MSKIQSNKRETLSFLLELRSRLIFSLVVLFFLFAVLLYFSNQLYTVLALPLLKYLPSGHLIATQIVAPFFVPVKLAFFAAFLCVIPIILYQIWLFIMPALYVHERRLLWLFVLVGTFLFYTGMVFTYFVIFPLLFQFLSKVAPVGVMFSPDISEYLDFTIKLLLVFGLLFEIPIIMVLLTSFNLVTSAQFKKWRSYAILFSFIIGMLVAPPDVFSQTLIALPIWFLYELGLFLLNFFKNTSHLF